MSITNNIAGMQINGGGKAAQSQAFGQGFGQSADLSSQGLFGFLEAFLQQMQGGLPSGAAENASQELGGFAEKIAALLKKNDITPEQIQGMQPQELAAKIAALLQQQNIQVPPTLQNMPVEDLSVKLAVMVQQNSNNLQADGAFTLKTSQPQIKASLTSDLIAPQVTSIQDAQTKDDIAKKISAMLEQQQADGFAAPLTTAQLQQLQADLAQLQNASGTVDTDTMVQLLADVKSFLKSQGVDEASIKDFLAKIPQSLEQVQPQTANAAVTATGEVAAQKPKAQHKQETADSSAQSAEADASLTEDVTNTWQNLQAANVLRQAEKKFAPDNRQAPLMAANTDTATYTAKQPENLTAKISGMNVNPAMINDMASGDGSGAGFGNGFGSQGQSQEMMGSTAFLQPLSADALQKQSFINYLNNAPSAMPSPTTQMINVQLQNNINAGINTMTLQLNPADLGRMDVRLKFSKDGTVSAHMTVDKPETLALLQKDATHLHRALEQSGLKTDENSLSFDLRHGQHEQANDFSGQSGRNSGGYGQMNDNFGSSALQAQIAIQSSGYITRSGVNIMV